MERSLFCEFSHGSEWLRGRDDPSNQFGLCAAKARLYSKEHRGHCRIQFRVRLRYRDLCKFLSSISFRIEEARCWSYSQKSALRCIHYIFVIPIGWHIIVHSETNNLPHRTQLYDLVAHSMVCHWSAHIWHGNEDRTAQRVQMPLSLLSGSTHTLE